MYGIGFVRFYNNPQSKVIKSGNELETHSFNFMYDCRNFIAPNAFADKNIQITISKGSSIKGCQYSYSCLQPDEMAASIWDTVIWTNQDNESHLIVSGSPQSGPDGWFSSNIIHTGKTFSHTFSMARPYPYFDILHPWDTEIVVVQTDKQNSNFYYNEQMKFWKKMGWQ